jgi:hypothetical protein
LTLRDAAIASSLLEFRRSGIENWKRLEEISDHGIYRWDFDTCLATREIYDDFDLPRLRLVSKAFCRASTGIMYRSRPLRFRPFWGGYPPRPGEPCQAQSADVPASLRSARDAWDQRFLRLMNCAMNNRVIRPEIQHLQVDLRNLPHHPDLDADKDSDEDIFSKMTRYQAVASNLHSVIAPLSSLRSFEFRLHHIRADGQDPLDLTDLHSLSAFLRNSLLVERDLLSQLTDLRLVLWTTYDFKRFSETCLAGRGNLPLKKLYLEVCDETGRNGSRWHFVEGALDMEESRPPGASVLQRKRPNAQFMSGIFDIVRQCPKLESLGLKGTQHLQGERLELHPDCSGLKRVYLDRVQFTAENFLENLRLTSHSPCLTSLWLEDIELTDGTWDQVFHHLARLEKLKTFICFWLGYTKDGKSGKYWNWDQQARRRCGANRAIWTRREADEVALEKLVKLVVNDAGGRMWYDFAFPRHEDALNAVIDGVTWKKLLMSRDPQILNWDQPSDVDMIEASILNTV